jgi:hypothetical protein
LTEFIIPPPQHRSGGDENARKEGSSFSSGRDLEKLADESQHGRREGIRDLISFWLKAFICIGSTIFIIGAGIWAWHILAWGCKWMSPADLASLQKGIGQVGIGAVFGFLIKSKFL